MDATMAQCLQTLQGRSDALATSFVEPSFGSVLLSKPPLQEVCGDIAGADSKKVKEVVQLADFWIGLLEGERADLLEDVSQKRQRSQQAKSQADGQAKTLQELEAEKKRLQSELESLQQSREEAIRDRHLLCEENEGKSAMAKKEVDAIVDRSKALEAELDQERQERMRFETHLVQIKINYAEALEKVDSLEFVTEYYEGQLRALLPNFEPANADSLGFFRRPARPADVQEPETSATTHEHSSDHDNMQKKLALLKGSLAQMRRMFKPEKRPKDIHEAEATPGHGTGSSRDAPAPTETPRSVSSASPRPPSNVNGTATTTPRSATNSARDKPSSADGSTEAGAARRKRWEMRVE